MAESAVFNWVSSALQEVTPWTALTARGTVRLALKKAGLDPALVNKTEMIVVIDRVLTPELEVRGISDAVEICQGLRQRLHATSFEAAGATPVRPENVFRRLLGNTGDGSPQPGRGNES